MGLPGREGPGGERPSELSRTTEARDGVQKTAWLLGLVWALVLCFVSEACAFLMPDAEQGAAPPVVNWKCPLCSGIASRSVGAWLPLCVEPAVVRVETAARAFAGAPVLPGTAPALGKIQSLWQKQVVKDVRVLPCFSVALYSPACL